MDLSDGSGINRGYDGINLKIGGIIQKCGIIQKYGKSLMDPWILSRT
jgi:hypothetical protein